MSAQGSFFEVEHTWGVAELNARITGALADAFAGEVWVRGEIHGLRPPNANGHVYFTLHEKGRGRAPSTMAAALFAKDRRRIERELGELHGAFALAEGLEVRVRGKVDYYPPSGKIQLLLSAVDPLHTLGRLAVDRDRVLRVLGAEGLLRANACLPLPAVPLHVGLVASDGSAGCTDFLHELESSGLGFRVSLCDARVQGAGAERTLLRALHVLARRAPDVVCIVRGGGARTDLVAFDGERLARAVATMPVPVLTGIGHEIDTSVVDEVAHTSFKTPTACAAGLIDQVRAYVTRTEATWSAVTRAAVHATTRHDERLARAARAVAGTTMATLRLEEQRTAAAADRLGRCATSGLDRAAARLERDAGRAEGAARLQVGTHERAVDEAGRRLRGPHVRVQLERLEAHLADAARRLGGAASRAVADAERRAERAASVVAANDPNLLLARGWSITHDTGGKLVRRATDVEPGDVVVTTFRDGTVRSTVETSTVTPSAGRPTTDTPTGDADGS